MTFLALKKAYSWIKNYWYIPLVVLLLIFGTLFLGKKPGTLIETLKNAIENHKKEVKALESIHKEEVENRRKNLEIYQKTIVDVENKYKEKNKKLEKSKRKEIKKLVENENKNPGELAKKISELMGFDVVISR